MKEVDGVAALEVWADYVCPYCYLAEAILAGVRAAGVAVEPRAFELRPAPVPPLDPAEPWVRRAWDTTVLPLAERLDVAMNFPEIVPRTRKAHEAAAFARERGSGDAMHAALYRGYWVERRDIGRIDVLVDIGAAIGLDRTELKVVLDIDTYTEQVIAEAHAALEAGVSGVPAFRSPHGLLVGLQPAAALRRLAGLDRGDD